MPISHLWLKKTKTKTKTKKQPKKKNNKTKHPSKGTKNKSLIPKLWVNYGSSHSQVIFFFKNL